MVVSFMVRPSSRGGLSCYDRTEARVSSVAAESNVTWDTNRVEQSGLREGGDSPVDPSCIPGSQAGEITKTSHLIHLGLVNSLPRVSILEAIDVGGGGRYKRCRDPT